MVKLDFFFLKMANGEIGFFLTCQVCMSVKLRAYAKEGVYILYVCGYFLVARCILSALFLDTCGVLRFLNEEHDAEVSRSLRSGRYASANRREVHTARIITHSAANRGVLCEILLDSDVRGDPRGVRLLPSGVPLQ